MDKIQQVFNNPRNRVNPDKWTLGYDHYATISKYIYDYKSLINFMRVCTRTTAPLNLHENLSVNILDVNDWKKIQTHTIHTDLPNGRPLFMENVEYKKFTGNFRSFIKYIDAAIYISCTPLGEDECFNLVSCVKILPLELLEVVRCYIVISSKNIIRLTKNSSCYKYVDKNTMMEIYKRSPIKALTFESLTNNIDKMKFFTCNLSTIIQQVVCFNIKCQFYDRFYANIKREGKDVFELNKIIFPLYNVPFNDYVSKPLESIIKVSTRKRYYRTKTALCDIGLNLLREITELLKDDGNEIVMKRDCFVTHENNFTVFKMVCYNEKDDRKYRNFIVAFLPRGYYISTLFNHYYDLEPINNSCVWVKNTNVIISICGSKEYLYDLALNAIMVDRSDFDDMEYFSKYRFITDIVVYYIDKDKYLKENKGNEMFFDINFDYNSTDFLSLKYKYTVDSNKMDFDFYEIEKDDNIFWKTRSLQHELGLEIQDIKTLKYSEDILDYFEIFYDRFIIKVEVPEDWSNVPLSDDILCTSTKKGILTYVECLNSGSEEILKKVHFQTYESENGNFLLYFLTTNDRDFLNEIVMEEDCV